MQRNQQAVFVITSLLMMTRAGALFGGDAMDLGTRAPRWQQVQSGAAAATQGEVNTAKAHAFRLKDQFNQTHLYRFPRDKVSVLIIADHRGSKQLEAWLRPIYEHFETRIAIDGVAELSILPRLAHGLARRLLRQQVSYPIMLDWSGDVTQAYNYQPGQANLFVIDRSGRIVLNIIGAVDEAKLQRVLRVLTRLVTDGPTDPSSTRPLHRADRGQ